MNELPFLNYGRHDVDSDDIAAVEQVLRGSMITQGPVVSRFEAALAERVGARYAVAVCNGTAALHIACLAAGFTPGSRGITSPLTFVASANCMAFAGGTAEFVDITADGLGIDPASLATELQRAPETSLLIPVLFGGLADRSAEIRDVAGSRPIIEDACHAFGGDYACGQPIGCGRYADMTVFSFHPVKPITTGEGGAVVTNDPDLAHRLRLLSSHGIERQPERLLAGAAATENGTLQPWYYEQQMLGYNYRLTDIQAALGLSQLGKLDRFIARRREIALYYDSALRGLPGLTLPQSSVEQRSRSGNHLYVLEVDYEKFGISRFDFVKRLWKHKVGSQVHYTPVYRQPYHATRQSKGPQDFPVTEHYFSRCLSIPLYPHMRDEDAERVVEAIRQSLQ